MEYETEAKIVYVLWGIFFIVSMMEHLLYLLGIGVPADVAHIFDAWRIHHILVDVAMLSLVILGYRGTDWASYGVMIFLGYTCFMNAFGFSTVVIDYLLGATSRHTSLYGILIPSLFMLPLRGISLYVLYRHTQREISAMFRNYRRAVAVIFPLLAVFSIIRVIDTLSEMYSTWEILDLYEYEPYFSIITAMVYAVLLITAVATHMNNQWAYAGCMVALSASLIVEGVWFLRELTRYSGYLRLLLLLRIGLICAYILILFILYKSTIIHVFGTEPSH